MTSPLLHIRTTRGAAQKEVDMRYLQLIALAAMLSFGGVAAVAQETPATPPAAVEEGTDWGWIGVLGLLGLAGLAGRRRNSTTLNR
jgi:MYXO-CTERM domain-containing protein